MLEPFEGIVDGQNIKSRFWGDNIEMFEIFMLVPAAMTQAFLTACLLDQNTPHGLGSGGEKMATAVPVWLVLPGLTSGVGDQTKICFVNECGSLKGLPWLFLSQPLSSQLTQFMINQRQQLL